MRREEECPTRQRVRRENPRIVYHDLQTFLTGGSRPKMNVIKIGLNRLIMEAKSMLIITAIQPRGESGRYVIS
jgi:hypothetical protein